MPIHVSPGPIMSQAVVHNGVAHLAGQVAMDNQSGDFATQTKEVFARIDKILADLRSDRTQMLSATIYLTDLADFPEMNKLWAEWLDGATPPARATVNAALVLPGLKIEIVVVAEVPEAG
ncbi:RidA family protein [Chachezhania sediminis]|uniref:RidA family protein n=1 Tax=Chachezhania sediminis TaxID=2599291 RepID=UPI0018EEEF64|nr:RidA family protein [Chachezhania sediminis]